MGKTFKEKRKHRRITSDIPLQYKELGHTGVVSTGSLTGDLSEGGARIRSRRFIALAARLMSEFKLPTSERPVKAISRVIWIKKTPSMGQHDVGLQFLEMAKDDKQAVANFVNQL
jgi:c-di-GMP-binding flagellar brake protein YcgR